MHASKPEYTPSGRAQMQPVLMLPLLALVLVMPVPAQEPPADAGAPEAQAASAPAEPAAEAGREGEMVLDTVVVTGEQPGPGLWTVSRDGRQMRVLGYVGPLPPPWNCARRPSTPPT